MANTLKSKLVAQVFRAAVLPGVAIAALSFMATVCSVAAQPSGDFYAGKTIKIVIGTTVGGEYDLYARLVASHIGRFIPGNPNVLVQSMPDAGGLTAIRYLANVAPRDGTVLIVPQVNIIQEGMLTSNAQYDPGSFQWIGRMISQIQVGLVSSKSGVTSIEGAKSKELIAGGYGNNPTTLNPRLLNRLIGTKFRIVAGYRGTGDVMLAWERGEVDVVTTSWDVLLARYSEQVKAKLAIPLYVNAVKRPSDLPDVPLMTEFGQTDGDKAFLEIYSVGAAIGRSLAAPPGVPHDRIEVWRAAFTKMLGDEGFKESVHSGNLRLDPLDGAAMTSSVQKVVSLPPETVGKARKFYEELLAQAN